MKIVVLAGGTSSERDVSYSSGKKIYYALKKRGHKVILIDIYLGNKNGEIYCLEANTLPGMTPTSLIPQEAMVMGIDYPSLCEKIIELSIR